MINILSRWRRVGEWVVEKDGRKGRGVEKWKVNWNEERSQGRVAERRKEEREGKREREKCAVGRVGKKKREGRRRVAEVKGNGYGPGGRSPYSKSPSTAFNYDVIANTDDGYFLRYTLYVTFAMRREAGRRQRRFSVQS